MKNSAYVIEIEQAEKETRRTMLNTRHKIATQITQITQLTNQLQEARYLLACLNKKYNQLTNNWNELEEWVESEYNRYFNDTENLVLSNVETMDYSRMLDKMKK